MAVGRISGPLLTANLLRDGRDLSFSNTHGDEPLLFLSVNDGRISVGKTSPGHELDITLIDESDVLNSTHFVADTAQLSNYTISGQTIQVPLGNIEFEASQGVYVSTLETQNLRITDNIISTENSNANINITPAGSGITQVHSDMNVYGEIYTPGNVIIGGNITLGNDDSDSVDFNSDLISNLIPDVHNVSNLGTSLKEWKSSYFKNGYFSTINTDSLTISGNVIETTLSTSDLELRSANTYVQVPYDNVEFNQTLTVNGNTVITSPYEFLSFSGGTLNPLSLQNIGMTAVLGGGTSATIYVNSTDGKLKRIYGNATTTLDINFDTNISTGNFLAVPATAFTGSGATYLELPANGSTVVWGVLQAGALGTITSVTTPAPMSNVTKVTTIVTTEISITGAIDFNSLNHNGTFTTDRLELEEIVIDGNTITTTTSNANLELLTVGANFTQVETSRFRNNTLSTGSGDITIAASDNIIVDSTKAIKLPIGNTTQRKDGTGRIRFNNSDNVFEGYGSENITFGGVYSENRQTRAIAHPTADTLNFYVQNVQTTTVDSSGVTTHGLQVEDIFANGNTITTNVSNSDLELSANGTGIIRADNWIFDGSIIDTDDTNNIKTLKNTLYGHYKFQGTYGVVIPSGDSSNRPSSPIIGDTRWNTQRNLMETWDGSTWIISSGASPVVSEEEFLELVDEWSLILG